MDGNNVTNQTVTIEPKRKSNVGLIIGIGCGVLLILGIIIAIIVVIAIVAFGSAGKKMTCTYKKTVSGCDVVATAKLKFNGSKRVDSVNLDGYVDCSGATYKDYMLESLESTLKSESNINNVRRDGDKIYYDYIDSAGLNLKDIKNSKVGVSYDEAKRTLESHGYVCE